MLVAVIVVGALLLLFLRVRASVNGGNISVNQQVAPADTRTMVSAENGARRADHEKEVIPARVAARPARVFFDFDRANINRNVYCIFDRIEEAVRQGRPASRIIVEGNADSIGPSWYNIALSRIRAMRVADSLSRRLGIPLKQIELLANGSAKPAASNGTREGRAENRRTEIHIFY